MLKLKGLIIIEIICLSASCERNNDWKGDELSISHSEYIGIGMQTGGYYYNLVNDRYYSVSFFYRDGTLLAAGGAFTSILEMDRYIENELINRDDYKESRTLWGVFEVDNNIVRYEHWYPSSGEPLKAYVREGEVLNDTTFHISESYRNVRGVKTEIRSKDETYFFRKFSPKPDSNNQYIE